MFAKFFIWLYLRVVGVRFYQLNFIPSQQEYRHTQCILYDGASITFKFHLVTHDEFIYVKGSTHRRDIKALLIHAEYDDSLPEEIKKWNKLAFYFPGMPVWFHKERFISQMMLLAYIDFIRSIKQNTLS